MTHSTAALPEPRPPQRAPRRRRGLAVVTVAATALAGLAFAPSAATAAVSPDADLLISEVYGGGGNSGGAFNQDFIELANVGDAPASLSGYSVQYASASGGNWAVTPLGDVTVPAGGQLLIGQAFGADTAQPAIVADVTGTTAMSGTGGKVALVSTVAPLVGTSGIAGLPEVVDLVGWGAANAFAGSAPAPATTNATSVSRGAEVGHTADNAADFTVGAPTPQGLGGTGPTPTPTPRSPRPRPRSLGTRDHPQGSRPSRPSRPYRPLWEACRQTSS